MQQMDFNGRMRGNPHDGDVVAGYRGQVSDFALEKVQYEYSKSLSCKNTVQENADGMYVGKYRCSLSVCTCAAYCGFHLPCRHIFIVRRHRQVTEVDLAIVSPRWLLCPGTAQMRAPNSQQSDSTGTHTVNSGLGDVRPMCATRAQRFKTLMAVFTPMASVLADLPQSQFPAYLTWVQDLDRQVRDGSWAAQEQHREATPNNDDSESATAPASDAGLQLSVDCDSDVEHDNPIQPIPSTANVTPSTSGFTLPRKVQQRGRPAMTRQRTFRVKQKAPKPVKNATDRPKRGKRKHGDARDNCAECGCVDPPKKARGPASASDVYVHWTQCEQCEFWYHDVCIGKTCASDDSYVCKKCLN